MLAIALALCLGRVSLIRLGGEGRHSIQQQDHYDYAGVVHFHTRYTGDAGGSVEDLVRTAAAQKVDFLISTEHNNLRAFFEHKEGWYGPVLFLSGAEMTRPEGYLLGLDLHDYPIRREDTTDKVLATVARQGGFAIVAHPESPRWKWRGADDPRLAGQEVLNLTDQFNTSTPLEKIAWLVCYPFNTPYAYLQMYHRPHAELARWDGIAQQRDFTGLYAPDFHQRLNLPGGFSLPFPQAADMLPVAHDHIVLKDKLSGDAAADKAAVYGAVRYGQLYMSMDSAADATGFFFSARQGARAAWMGGDLPAGKDTAFSVRLPSGSALRDEKIVVYRNGREFAHSVATAYDFHAAAPGAYRVEVQGRIPAFIGGRDITWIYSNPIYLR